MRTLLTAFSFILTLHLATVPAVAAVAPLHVAIVIGHNGSPDSRGPALRFADDDAVATYELLLDAGVTAALFVDMDADTQRLHRGLVPMGPPDLDAILAHFERVAGLMNDAVRAGRVVEFSLFYSGHGDVEHGEGFVALRRGRLTRRVLYEGLLARSAATRNHVFVDACKSYFLAFERGPGGSRIPFSDALPPIGASVMGRTGFILSTSSARDSHEWEGFQAGVFSHELRSALRGAADVDGDGRVTYNELGAFLTATNAGILNERFRPDALIQPPAGDLAGWEQSVITWPKEHASLLFDGDAEHLYGETAMGLRLFDVHARQGETRRLQLPAGVRVFIHDMHDTWERLFEPTLLEDGAGDSPAAAPHRFSQLAATHTSLVPRGAANLAIRELFAQPFGIPDVMEYAQARQPRPEIASAPSRGASVAPWLAAGSALVGLGLDTWAWERYRAAADGGSQARRVALNGQVQRLHAAALGCYGVGALAAGLWLYQAVAFDARPSTNVRLAASIGSASEGLWVHLAGAW